MLECFRVSQALLTACLAASLVFAMPVASFSHDASLPGTFVDVTKARGVDVMPVGGRADWGHGAAFCDYNGDGLLDLYVVMGTGQPNRLFSIGSGGVTVEPLFVDIAGDMGCADGLNGRGIVWADYDNDGDPDFFLANLEGANRLYRNDGAGGFVDVAASAGLDHTGKPHSAAWGDYDNNGFVDLYVCSYGTTREAFPNLLYRNEGDGTFTEVAAAAGVADPNKPAMVCVWIDYDNDGDSDLYIAYDKYAGNTMYRNEGDGTFTDVTVASGTYIEFNAMGIAVGDYDHNGYLDMYITNTDEGNELLHNNGDGTFEKMAQTLGLLVGKIGWGTAFLDFDNDGDEDLYVVNWAYSDGNPAAGNEFFRNDGGTFTEVTEQLGVGNTGPGYGLTVGDYNNDGFVDMFVNNQSTEANVSSVLYENVPTGMNWLKIKTVGTASNRDGIGAKIRVKTGTLTQIKDVRSGSSYLSQLSPEVEFGLGASSVVDWVEISWPSGIVDVFESVAVDQYVVATERGSLRPAVFIRSVKADGRRLGIDVVWDIMLGGPVDGYHLYRRAPGSTEESLLNDGRLIDQEATNYFDSDVKGGASYEYRVAVVTDGAEVGWSEWTLAAAPTYSLALLPNVPNPFNPGTLVRFTLDAPSRVRLDVFDVAGHHVVSLLDEARPEGVHEFPWDGRDSHGLQVSSGVYFYRLEASGRLLTRRMVVLR